MASMTRAARTAFLVLSGLLSVYLVSCSDESVAPGPIAGPAWVRQSPLPTGSALSDAWAIDANTLVAVGSGGTILRTSDSGVSWTFPAGGHGHG